jgi:hypothetical protein
VLTIDQRVTVMRAFYDGEEQGTLKEIRFADAAAVNAFNTATGTNLATVDSAFVNSFHVSYLPPKNPQLITGDVAVLLQNGGTGMGNLGVNINNAAAQVAAGLNLPASSLTQNSPGPDLGDFLDFGQAIGDYLSQFADASELPTLDGLLEALRAYGESLWGALAQGNLIEGLEIEVEVVEVEDTAADPTGADDHDHPGPDTEVSETISEEGGLDPVTQDLRFNFRYDMRKTEPYELDLNSVAASLGLNLDELGQFDVSISLVLDFTFGIRMTQYLDDRRTSRPPTCHSASIWVLQTWKSPTPP